jgi:hypothetical protein
LYVVGCRLNFESRRDIGFPGTSRGRSQSVVAATQKVTM